MKILLVNKFFYRKGGSETVFFETAKLLEKRGHKVIYFSMAHPLNIASVYEKYFVSNVDYEKGGIADKISASFKVLYSFEAKRKIEMLIKDERPDIAHLHNFAHQISPSILEVLKRHRIPSVMSMHDYKMVCPVYSMLSAGEVCEECRGERYYQCLFRRCTKSSLAKSLINTVEMYLHHNILHIYDSIDIFIAPSIFLKNKLEEMGFRKHIVHLPHFLNSAEYVPKADYLPGPVCYFGRLSREKGVSTLLEAVKGTAIDLKIIGTGPLKEVLERKAREEGLSNVAFLGHKSGEELRREIKSSALAVFPSECYEVFGLSILEAFALGLPVIGSRIGPIPELIQDGRTGMTFKTGDADDLKNKMMVLKDDIQELTRMGRNARTLVEREYTADIYYERLMEIYKTAIGKS